MNHGGLWLEVQGTNRLNDIQLVERGIQCSVGPECLHVFY